MDVNQIKHEVRNALAARADLLATEPYKAIAAARDIFDECAPPAKRFVDDYYKAQDDAAALNTEAEVWRAAWYAREGNWDAAAAAWDVYVTATRVPQAVINKQVDIDVEIERLTARLGRAVMQAEGYDV